MFHFTALGPNAKKAHNPRDEGIIHYHLKKGLKLDIIKEMINIIDMKYEGALMEDLEKVNLEGEDVFSEIEIRKDKNLLDFFNKIGDDMLKNNNFVLI